MLLSKCFFPLSGESGMRWPWKFTADSLWELFHLSQAKQPLRSNEWIFFPIIWNEISVNFFPWAGEFAVYFSGEFFPGSGEFVVNSSGEFFPGAGEFSMNFPWISCDFFRCIKTIQNSTAEKFTENSLAPGKNSREKLTRRIHLKFTCTGEKFTGKIHWPWEKSTENSPATHKKVE